MIAVDGLINELRIIADHHHNVGDTCTSALIHVLMDYLDIAPSGRMIRAIAEALI